MTKLKSAQEMQDMTIAWAKNAGFFNTTTADIQLEKFLEEHDEVLYAVKGYYGELTITEAKPEDLGAMATLSPEAIKEHWLEKIKDGVGDSMVTYFIQCELRGLTPTAIKDTTTISAIIDRHDLTTHILYSQLPEMLDSVQDNIGGDTYIVIADLCAATGTATWIGFLFGFTPEECFDHAYAIISKRLGKGKVIDGIFVKEEDLPDNEAGYYVP